MSTFWREHLLFSLFPR
jgi:hypothetical protein